MSAEAFSPPVKQVSKQSWENFRSGVSLNMTFFLSNYALVAFCVALVVALLHPGMLLLVGIVCSLWWLHEYLITHKLKIFERNIGQIVSINQRSTILTTLSLFTIIYWCLMPFLTFVAVSGVIILSHAIMRDPKHVERSNNFIQDDGDSEEEVMVERGDVILGGGGERMTTSISTLMNDATD